jgi:hypothetical protein
MRRDIAKRRRASSSSSAACWLKTSTIAIIVRDEGSYWATNKVLDPAFLRSLEGRIGARSLPVGVPRRGTMRVAAIDPAAPRKRGLLAWLFRRGGRGGGG